MTRTEQLKLLDRAGRYLTIAEQMHHTSMATLLCGVPLTLAAFTGLSPWPGVIYWVVSWFSYSLGKHYMACARELRKAVQRAREEIQQQENDQRER